MEVTVAVMGTTPMCRGTYKKLSEPINSIELEHRTVSKGCHSRSKVRRGLKDKAVPTV